MKIFLHCLHCLFCRRLPPSICSRGSSSATQSIHLPVSPFVICTRNCHRSLPALSLPLCPECLPVSTTANPLEPRYPFIFLPPRLLCVSLVRALTSLPYISCCQPCQLTPRVCKAVCDRKVHVSHMACKQNRAASSSRQRSEGAIQRQHAAIKTLSAGDAQKVGA